MNREAGSVNRQEKSKNDIALLTQYFSEQDETVKRPVRIIFYGDFSAGKTSLIERLIRADYLPHKEAPTTAHPVVVRQGKRAVRIVYKDGLRRKVKGKSQDLTFALSNQ